MILTILTSNVSTIKTVAVPYAQEIMHFRYFQKNILKRHLELHKL